MVVLIGAGGHAKSVLAALGTSRPAAGYVDRAECALPLPYLGNDDDFISRYSPTQNELIITMVSGRSCSLQSRAALIERYKGCRFATVIAPTAFIALGAVIGEGSAVMHRAVVNVDTIIGCHCVINTAAVVEHDCRIGDNVFIGPGAVICGGVTIGNNVYIGANCTLRPGVSVSDNITIGLGAAVVNDLSEPGTYAGVPTKLLKK